MAIPLTKRRKIKGDLKVNTGELYVRLSKVDEEIDEAINLNHIELQERLSITNPQQSGYLSSETLIYLIRNGLRASNRSIVGAVFKVVVIRCEANLRKHVSNSLPNAQHIREEVLAELGSIIAHDGRGNVPNRLDLFEWRFNLQFKSLRLDAIRRETREVNRIASISDDASSFDIADVEAAFEKVANTRKSSDSNVIYAPSPEDQMIARDIYNEIMKLPKNERDALIATKILGLTEKAAGKMLGVSDRTIRTRKKDAIARLESLKENT